MRLGRVPPKKAKQVEDPGKGKKRGGCLKVSGSDARANCLPALLAKLEGPDPGKAF